MKKTFLSLVFAGVILFSKQETQAQAKFPPASSTTKIEQGIGIKKVSLVYQRPNINGRTIFGGLVPFDQVWRTGANSIPAITFEEDVILAGHKVPAGTYGLFTIPTKGDWTVILSKNVEIGSASSRPCGDDFRGD